MSVNNGNEEVRVVYTFTKNGSEEVRATLGEFHGHLLASLRVWKEDDNGDGDHATRKGISVRVEQLPHLLAAVQALEEAHRAA
jgi:hypothetical protein